MTRLRAKRHIPERMEACKELWFQFPAANKGKWREVCGFPDECELFLEIGCGKGKFCTETATANPQALYIALERESSVILAAIEKTKELGIKNLFFVNADAKNLLEYFEENEVDRIYLNFSDPWTRKKKPKRRLTYRDFLKVYETIMKPGGEVRFKTDNTLLFEFSVGEFTECGFTLSEVTRDLHNSEWNEGNVRTEFEQKFADEGIPIKRLVATAPTNDGCCAESVFKVREKATGIVILLVILLFIGSIMLYCNSHTGLLVDDYAYMFDFSTGTCPDEREIYPAADSIPVTGVPQILKSMEGHRMYQNGRVVSHFGVQFFLLFSKNIFNICNTLMFVFQLILIYICSTVIIPHRSYKETAVTVMLSFICLWMFEPSFGEVNLWLDGSLNYLWTSTLCLGYVYFLLRLYRDGRFSDKAGANILCLVLAFLVGASHEMCAVAAIVMSFLIIMYNTLFLKKRDLWSWIALLFTAAGFLTVILAPSEMRTRLMSAATIHDKLTLLKWNYVMLASSEFLFIPMLISILILKRKAFKDNLRVKNVTILLVFTFFISSMPLLIAAYFAGRTLFFPTVLLCLCVNILVRSVMSGWDNKTQKVMKAVFALLSIICVISLVIGMNDIRKTYEFTTSVDEYLNDCAMAGYDEVFIPDISRDGMDSHCALKQLKYVDYYDPESWPNIFYAKFYGFESVSFSGQVLSLQDDFE